MDLNTLSIPQLQEQWKEIGAKAADLKAEMDAVLAALSVKAKPHLRAIFDNKGKTSGDVTDTIEGVKVKFEISKEVKWDDALLKEAAALVPVDKVNGIFDAKLSIKEATFKVLSVLLDADNPAIAKIIEARTVKLGEP